MCTYTRFSIPYVYIKPVAYRCLRKNKKSRWLCRVTTWRPWNSGIGGKRVWNKRPTAWPKRVTKLLRINSGSCGVARAWPLIVCLRLSWHYNVRYIRRTKICRVNSMEVSLKRAVGPSGRRISVMASIMKNMLIITTLNTEIAYLAVSCLRSQCINAYIHVQKPNQRFSQSGIPSFAFSERILLQETHQPAQYRSHM